MKTGIKLAYELYEYITITRDKRVLDGALWDVLVIPSKLQESGNFLKNCGIDLLWFCLICVDVMVGDTVKYNYTCSIKTLYIYI